MLEVRLPPLPSSAHLRLREDTNADADTDDAEELADGISVGGAVWPSAASLCRWLRGSAEAIRGTSVLELGAGTGACGLYAACLGATRVTLTEGSSRLQRLISSNIEANRPLLPAGTHVEHQRLLWGLSPPPHGPWHWVLGSDLTYGYDPTGHEELAATLSSLLRSSDPRPRVILSHHHRNRRPADALRASAWDSYDESMRLFTTAAAEAGLEVAQLAWEAPSATCNKQYSLLTAGFDEWSADVSIVEVRRARGRAEVPVDE